MEDQRILVLGATGLIGLPLATELAKKNRVIGVSRCERMAPEALAERGVEPLRMDVAHDPIEALPDGIDYVFNEVLLYHPTDHEASMETNAYPVAKLMGRYGDCKGIVLGSTGSVYAETGKPMAENARPGGTDAYSVSKICAEMFAVHFSRERGIPTSILRYYQPYDTETGVVPSLKGTVLAGKPVHHPWQCYTPLFISDVVRFTIQAASLCAYPPMIVNVGGEETVSREKLVWKLCEAMGKDPGAVPLADDDSCPSEIGDSTERIRLFGKQQVPLEEGVRRVAEALKP